MIFLHYEAKDKTNFPEGGNKKTIECCKTRWDHSYLQSKDSSKSITKILNGLLFLSCLQLLKRHIFITPATNSNFPLKLKEKTDGGLIILFLMLPWTKRSRPASWNQGQIKAKPSIIPKNMKHKWRSFFNFFFFLTSTIHYRKRNVDNHGINECKSV